MSFWKKLVIGIVVVYIILAVVRLIVYGWSGVLDFLTGPVNWIIGAFTGIGRGISKAPESYQAGKEAARNGVLFLIGLRKAAAR